MYIKNGKKQNTFAYLANWFLINNFLQILSTIKRHKFLVYALEIIQLMQIFNLQLTQHTIDNFFQDIRINPDMLIKFFQIVLLYPCLQFLAGITIESAFLAILYLSTTFHILFFAILILAFIVESYQIYFPKLIMTILTFFCSLFFNTYYQFFMIPFMKVYLHCLYNTNESFTNTSNIILSMINIMLLFTMVFIYLYVQFEYKLIIINYDSRRYAPSVYLFIFIIDMILCLLFFSDIKQYIQILHALSFAIKLLFNQYYQPVHCQMIQSLKITESIIYVIYSIIMYMSTSSTEQAQFDPLLLFIMTAPFSVLLSNRLQKLIIQRFMLSKLSKTCSIHELDTQIRLLVEFFLVQQDERVSSEELRLLFYQGLIVKHISECKDLECLMCSEWKNQSNAAKNINESAVNKEQKRPNRDLNQYITTTLITNEGFNRNQFVKMEINKIFTRYFDQKKAFFRVNNIFLDSQYTSTYYLNLFFKIEIEQNVTQSFMLLFNLKSRLMYCSLLHKQVIRKIEKEIYSQFRHLFKHSEYQNQRLQIHFVAEFDQRQKDLNCLLQQSLQSLQHLYMLIGNNLLDLESLQKTNLKIMNSKQVLNQNLQFLFDLNPCNQHLMNQAKIYHRFFDENQSLEHFVHQSKNLPKQQLVPLDNGLDIFNQNQCAIIISLVKALGEIKKASNNVKQVFLYEVDELQQQNCAILIPFEIQHYHNQILQDFVHQGSIQVIKDNATEIFASDKSGFILQINRRISLYYDDQDLYGVTLLHRIHNNDCNFILYNESEQIFGVSEFLYERLFFRLTESPNGLMRFKICSFLPILKILQTQQNIQSQITFQTIWIQPFSRHVYNQQPSLVEPYNESFPNFFKNINKIKQFHIFDIKFQIDQRNVRNKFLYYQMKVFSVQLIKDKQVARDQLAKLSKDIYSYFNVNSQFNSNSVYQLASEQTNSYNNYQMNSRNTISNSEQSPKNPKMGNFLDQVQQQPPQPPKTQQLLSSRFFQKIKIQQQSQTVAESALDEAIYKQQALLNIDLDPNKQGLNDNLTSISKECSPNVIAKNPMRKNSVGFTQARQQEEQKVMSNQSLLLGKGLLMKHNNQLITVQKQLSIVNSLFNIDKAPAAAAELDRRKKSEDSKPSQAQDEEKDGKQDERKAIRINDETKQIINLFFQNLSQKSKLAKRIQIIAFLAFLTLLVANIIGYVEMQRNFLYSFDTFNLISISPDINLHLDQLIITQEFNSIVQNNQELIRVYFTQDDLKKNFNKLIKHYQYEISQNLIKSIYDKTGQVWEFNEQRVIRLNLIQDINSFVYQNVTLNYANILLQFYSNVYSHNIDNQAAKKFIIENFLTYTDQYHELMKYTSKNANSTIQSMRSLIFVTILIIEIVGLVINLIIFPIYIMIQRNRQKILRLFGTFPQYRLDIYCNQVQEELKNLYSFSSHDVQAGELKVQKNSQNKKKKTISDTTELEKFNYLLMFFSIFCIAVNSIFPLVNMVQLQFYLSNFEYNEQDQITIFSIQSQLYNTFAYNNILLQQKLTGNDITAQQMEQSDQLQKEINENMKLVLSLLDGNVNLERSVSQEYQEFINEFLHGNICTIIFFSQLPNLIIIDEEETALYKDSCVENNQGILTKGFTQCYTYIKQQFQNIREIMNEKNPELFKQQIRLYDQSNHMFDLYRMQVYLDKLFDILIEKLNTDTQIQYSNADVTQDNLFIITIIMLILIFSIGWRLLIDYFSRILNQTKEMLGVFRMDQIQDNPYILQYFKSEFKGISVA